MLGLVASAIGCQSSDSDADTPEAGAELNVVRSPAVITPPPNVEGNGSNASREAASERDAAAAPAPPVSSAPAAAFAACTTSGGAYSDCDILYVTMVQTSPARCVQVSIDNCGTRGGLPADLPASWRLASASVGSSSAPCELGVFYPANTSISDTSGSISWNETTRLPTDIELELTLELPGSTGGAASIEVANSEPLNPSPCD